jgi:crotonobetainyl-CoA:carnitine CoA-transferase CaiB-like acyl-CoA transferase
VVELGTDHLPQVRHPVRYHDTGPSAVTPPPRLGEHTDLVRAWLGSSGEPLPRRRSPHCENNPVRDT